MSQPPKKHKFDSIPLGAILGLVTPLLFFVGYFFVRYPKMHFGPFLRYLATGGIMISVLSLCVFVGNLLTFFIFIWTDRDKSSRGVVLTTILITIVVGVLKSLGK
jgi:hypothetical protein